MWEQAYFRDGAEIDAAAASVWSPGSHARPCWPWGKCQGARERCGGSRRHGSPVQAAGATAAAASSAQGTERRHDAPFHPARSLLTAHANRSTHAPASHPPWQCRAADASGAAARSARRRRRLEIRFRRARLGGPPAGKSGSRRQDLGGLEVAWSRTGAAKGRAARPPACWLPHVPPWTEPEAASHQRWAADAARGAAV